MPVLNCIALPTTGTRKIPGKDLRPGREVRWQEMLFEQGYERRKFRLELPDGQAPFAEHTRVELTFELSVNNYGDLELARAGRQLRVVTSEKAKV